MATGKQEAQRLGREKMSASEKERTEGERMKEESEVATSEAASSTVSRRKPFFKQEITPKIPEAVDDFLRNFLLRHGLSRTLRSFETEWYGSAQKLLTQSLSGISFLPDAHTHRKLLQSELQRVQRETEQLRQEVLEAGENLMRVQRERDFHRLQYKRVAEHKNRLIEDIKRLKKHLESYEPVLRLLTDKYQAALRQKTLIALKKDRLQKSTEARNQEKSKNKEEINKSSTDKQPANKTKHRRDKEFLVCRQPVNSDLNQVTSVTPLKNISSFSLYCSIRAHELPISCIDLHPHKRIVASASDDSRWKLWALPSEGEKVGEMIIMGKVHSGQLSGCSLNPDGTKLATTSGDTKVRLWDFSYGRCVLALSGHGQPTLGCSFHYCGHSLASCSSDRSAKLWDLKSQRCLLTLRHHTDSVNSVCFLPFSNLLLTSSADKTLAMWDNRHGFCTATYHGHQHPCNHAASSPTGNIMASCDSHGVVHLWDTRKHAFPMATIDAGPMAANQVAFSSSGKRLAVGSSDSLVRLVEVDSHTVSYLSGHSDYVQSITFDHKGETVISAGSDGFINIWS